MTEQETDLDRVAIIETLVQDTIKADLNHSHETMMDLIRRNGELGNPGDGFLIGSVKVTHLHPDYHGHIRFKPVHQDLLIEVGRYMAHRRKMEQDSQRMVQGFNLLLKPCKTFQDVRDALPDVVRAAIPEISQLPRTREEAWPLLEKPFQLVQFQHLKDLIFFYYANRMLL